MDLFNKAKEAAEKYTGGGDSSKKDDKKEGDSIFSKAMGAVEKYHVKDKAAEYAQKQVAKRNEEKLQPGYVEKKDKSIVDKAKEAAEDFLAKQGTKPEQAPVSKPEVNNRESSSSSSSSCSYSEKRRPHSPRSPQPTPVLVQQAATPTCPPSSVEATRDYPAYPSGNTSSYPNARMDESFSRMNLGNDANSYSSYAGTPSSSGKYESYQDYWSRQNNDAPRQPRYTGEATYDSSNASPPYPPRVESSSAYYNNERDAPRFPSGGDGRELFGDTTSSRDSYPSGSFPGQFNGRSGGERNYEGRNDASGSDSGRYQSSEEYYGRSGGDAARNYPSYSSPASGYGQNGARELPGSSRPYGNYASNDHV
ncbi:hypothetical protein PHYPSEUDO_009954 [Phytophthora pseudosyringae]|uniref:Uncharacterized protein n=1 Tax=Phytophthora pseudosyringae TaxID=221518 RepID=A0A8T1VB21_9STRA|nr:hypothetical protein PHYPSEUDO_009954 [Phytophthora pseudosyringae]